MSHSAVIFAATEEQEELSEVVPFSWVTEDETHCYWPSGPQNVEKLINKATPPVTEGDKKWSVHDIVHYEGPFDLLTARRHAKRLTYKNDGNTTDYQDEDGKRLSRKRSNVERLNMEAPEVTKREKKEKPPFRRNPADELPDNDDDAELNKISTVDTPKTKCVVRISKGVPAGALNKNPKTSSPASSSSMRQKDVPAGKTVIKFKSGGHPAPFHKHLTLQQLLSTSSSSSSSKSVNIKQEKTADNKRAPKTKVLETSINPLFKYKGSKEKQATSRQQKPPRRDSSEDGSPPPVIDIGDNSTDDDSDFELRPPSSKTKSQKKVSTSSTSRITTKRPSEDDDDNEFKDPVATSSKTSTPVPSSQQKHNSKSGTQSTPTGSSSTSQQHQFFTPPASTRDAVQQSSQTSSATRSTVMDDDEMDAPTYGKPNRLQKAIASGSERDILLQIARTVSRFDRRHYALELSLKNMEKMLHESKQPPAKPQFTYSPIRHTIKLPCTTVDEVFHIEKMLTEEVSKQAELKKRLVFVKGPSASAMAGKFIPALMIPEVANEFNWNEKEPSFKQLVVLISIIGDIVSQNFPAIERVNLMNNVMTGCRNWLHNNRKKYRGDPVGGADDDDDDGYGQHDADIEGDQHADRNKNEEKVAAEDNDSSDGTLKIADNNTKTATKDDSSEEEA